MDTFGKREMDELLRQDGGPCLSVYMPTHRGGSEQDPIRLKNLLRDGERRLADQGVAERDARELLAPARALLDDGEFWKTQGSGLALFLAPGRCLSYRLPETFPELVEAGEGFHVKPLLPLADGGHFYVLALSQNHARLYRGGSEGLTEVATPAVPQGIEAALRTHDRDEPLTFHTRPLGAGRWAGIFSGQGVGIDDHKSDLLLYFRAVDRGIHEVIKDERAPLVLASVEALWPIYRQANRYANLVEAGVAGCPDHVRPAELHARAWAVVRSVFHAPAEKAAALYARLAGTPLASDDLGELVRAARQGMVETLFVDRWAERWGTVEPGTGVVIPAREEGPAGQGLLNLAAVHTLRHGGTVFAAVPGEMPVGGLAAGIYRPPGRR